MFANTQNTRRAAPLLIGLIVAGIGAFQLLHLGSTTAISTPNTTSKKAKGTTTANSSKGSQILVFVSGAVEQPGLYRLAPNARGTDAIAAAGGIATDADLTHLPNLAQILKDGKQINVPFQKASKSSSSKSKVNAKLDINSATLGQLYAIPGMPPGLPEALIKYRQQWGPLPTIRELKLTFGVDPGVATQLSRYLKIGP